MYAFKNEAKIIKLVLNGFKGISSPIGSLRLCKTESTNFMILLIVIGANRVV